MKNNPIKISNYIKKEFSNYISSTQQVNDPEYQKKIERELENSEIYKGPYLHLTMPFTKGDTISELVNKGVLNSDFKKLESLNFERPLYAHQMRSIERVKKGHSVVVTTGTGSGKTESFLFPILNSIMDLVNKGQKKVGIKAIILYPLNALVNDQIERLRAILSKYPDITYGSYTGNTKEDNAKEYRIDMKNKGIIIPKNELVDRNEIRNNPPDILFTNYSMLEYLLIRPTDSFIIDSKYMSQWQFFVLDEAHTYKGASAIEISMLLRRLTAFQMKKPQFILTSATLGDVKSLDEIIRFAKNLTATDYDAKDVIFADRECFKTGNYTLEIEPDFYDLLLKSIDDNDKVYELINGKLSVEKQSTEEMLYDLFVVDKNVLLLYEAINKTNLFDNVLSIMKQYHFNKENLVALIQLISLAQKNYKSIYDNKYHMFVRTLRGAYVTLGLEKEVRFNNHKFINGKKAFEIGSCKNCNQMYLIGRIVDDFFEQNEEIDIYENYADNNLATVDYLFLKQNEEYEDLDEYRLCSKCGKIIPVNAINVDECDCGEENYILVYRANKEKSEMKNNLYECPCCSGKNNKGIVKSFSLNKDNATSLLSQILYQALENKEDQKNKEIENIFIDAFFEDDDNIEEQVKKVNQLLVFSDSRQQASYFSVNFNYNHERILRRRLIWEEIKDLDELKLKSLIVRVSDRIRKGNLFKSGIGESQKEAWIAVIYDILHADGIYGPEGLGLYSFDFEFDYQFDSINNSQTTLNMYKDSFEKTFNLGLDDIKTLIRFVVDQFRHKSIVNYGDAELMQNDKIDALPYTQIEQYVIYNKEVGSNDYNDKFIVSFTPSRVNQKNVIYDYMSKLFPNAENITSKQGLMYKLWTILWKAGIIEKINYQDKDVYQVNVNRFKVVPYFKKKWYICPKCNKITLFNINNICPTFKCNGKLIECDPDKLFTDNYYRKQFMTKKIERIIIEEHTAQLNNKIAKEYQERFKNKDINILSCSTTFEMGVDLGALENVFMRNVPPTPANYAQRAGRAGRSKDSSAFVMTYCGNTPHDFLYFKDPIPLIEGSVVPPNFDVSNEKIIIRHLLATAFGFFFRSKKETFTSLGDFMKSNYMDLFIDYLNNYSKKLINLIDNYIIPEEKYHKYRNKKWISIVLNDQGVLAKFIDKYKVLIKELEESIQIASNDQDFGLANSFQLQLKAIESEKILNVLSSNAIIPKYGFPVDLVNLDIIKNKIDKNRIDDKYLLQRNLNIAISEYAPGSEVIVDGNKYTSRYINLPFQKELRKMYYVKCNICDTMNVGNTPFANSISYCSVCQGTSCFVEGSFYVPDLGFSTNFKENKSKQKKPIKTYAGNIEYIGKGTTDLSYSYKNLIEIHTIKEDELMVANYNNFYTCKTCGYSILDKKEYAKQKTKKHNTKYGLNCDNDKLEKWHLGHVFKTDVIKLDFSFDLNYEEALSLLYALLEGISHGFHIERNDINGLLLKHKNDKYHIVIFDNVPGGAGYVKRLTNENEINTIFQSAYNVVDKCTCDENTSCYSCLQSYSNQHHHKSLKRVLAKNILNKLLK